MVKCQPSKLDTRVRFPHPAQNKDDNTKCWRILFWQGNRESNRVGAKPDFEERKIGRRRVGSREWGFYESEGRKKNPREWPIPFLYPHKIKTITRSVGGYYFDKGTGNRTESARSPILRNERSEDDEWGRGSEVFMSPKDERKTHESDRFLSFIRTK